MPQDRAATLKLQYRSLKVAKCFQFTIMDGPLDIDPHDPRKETACIHANAPLPGTNRARFQLYRARVQDRSFVDLGHNSDFQTARFLRQDGSSGAHAALETHLVGTLAGHRSGQTWPFLKTSSR